ncbi:MAG: hypothetical protein ACRDNI_04605, partial [Gaiellaceae bacterium]
MSRGVRAGVALGAIVLLVAAVMSRDSAAPAAEVVAWRELPPPPLSPREFPTGFWTGSEIVLVGGSHAPPCHPSASCRPPDTPPLADGAAYDPRTGSWRTIPDAPVGFAWAEKVALGSTAYLWIAGEPWRPEAPRAFLAYRFDGDRWEELPLPTHEGEEGWYHLANAGDRVVAYSSSDEERERPDFVFDPASETWSELPDDPFSSGFDRVLIWSGQELLLFDHEIVPNPGGDGEPLPLRGAALDLRTDEWRILEDPDAAYEASVPVWDDSLAGILDDSGAR